MLKTDCIFCTLFDSNYLDKGITLYKSMEKHISEFKLYVITFDDICYKVLKKENYPRLIPISLEEFETEDLLRVKRERTRAEYSWTCSSWAIKYVLEHFDEPICTYIDADMCFFSSPQVVFDEMKKKDCSIIIVPHRFKSIKAEKEAHDEVGSYCVEFNTFKNDEKGNQALSWWAERCLEWCFYTIPGTTEWYGDQKYLNVFPEKFDGVMVCNHYGVGLAPWNINLVDYCGCDLEIPMIKVKSTGEIFDVIIHHFENVSFLSRHVLHSSSRTSSKEIHQFIYDPYIKELVKYRSYIEKKYNITLSRNKRVVTKSPLMRLYQKYISPFRRVKHIKDLYWVK